MKRFITLVLTCILILSCTGCAFMGDPKWQEEEALAFAEKYYSSATIVNKEHLFLNTATVYTMKDNQYGFEYSLVAMEVYMSDLSFATSDDSKDKTIVFDSNYAVHYLNYIINNKVDKTKLDEIGEKYKDINFLLSAEQTETSLLDVTSGKSYQIAFVMDTLNTSAITETASLLKSFDDRDVLSSMTLPIYIGTTNEELSKPNSYFDLYFNRVITEDEYDGVVTLRDYLKIQGYQSALITSIDTKYESSKITLATGQSWSDIAETTGTYILFTADGKNYEFYTEMIVDTFNTEQDSEYGIYKGSFLDIMATEDTGYKPIMISMYATMMPNYYQSLSLYMKEIKEVAE